MAKTPISFKLDETLLARLRSATSGLYAPSQTAIVERGIDLALRELNGKRNIIKTQDDRHVSPRR